MISPEDLSPAPASSRPSAPLPFGITWQQIAPGLPGFVSGGSAWVSHAKRGRHQGGRPTVIMTLAYAGAGGRPRELTVFFKQNTAATREGPAYGYLARAGISVPELLLCLDRGGDEVLGLEFLPSIGLHGGDVDDLLQQLAALQSLTDVPADVAALGPGLPRAAFEQLVAAAVERVAVSCPARRPLRWIDLYRRAVDVHQSFPRALTHGELAAQQVGRTRTDRFVILDWATLGERARFTDVANTMQDLVRLSGQDESVIMDRYLHHLRRAGGPPVSAADAWSELRLTRFVQELEALPWRTGLDDPDDLERHVITIATDYPAVRQLLRG